MHTLEHAQFKRVQDLKSCPTRGVTPGDELRSGDISQPCGEAARDTEFSF
jgi:hypothetical protein